jgi:hypothetical protein
VHGAAFTFVRNLCLIGTLACAASPAAAVTTAAAKPTPDLTIKNKAVEASVFIDARIDTILWDANAKKRISIRPFFTETADDGPTMQAIRKGVIASLNIEKKKRDSSETATAEWYKGLEPKLLKIGAVTLAPSTEAGKSSGLTFHYPPYAVGPYAEGEYVAFVPWETLKPYLTPEGAKIFGGARPKGDDDGTR